MSDKEEEKQLCFPSSVSLFLKNPVLTAHRMERRQISNKNPPPRTPCGLDSSDSARLGAREKGHGCVYSPTLVQPPQNTGTPQGSSASRMPLWGLPLWLPVLPSSHISRQCQLFREAREPVLSPG